MLPNYRLIKKIIYTWNMNICKEFKNTQIYVLYKPK